MTTQSKCFVARVLLAGLLMSAAGAVLAACGAAAPSETDGDESADALKSQAEGDEANAEDAENKGVAATPKVRLTGQALTVASDPQWEPQPAPWKPPTNPTALTTSTPREEPQPGPWKPPSNPGSDVPAQVGTDTVSP
jgi:hypothetical protein